MNPNWLTIQQGIAEELISLPKLAKHNDAAALNAFAQHLSQQLAEALKRGEPKITESLILQINCLKALHGILIPDPFWYELLEKVQFILKIGVLFLL